LQRGQQPVFVPNYYRGAWRLHPRTAGRSSQLFNTGTAAWMYRCLVEELFGLRGDGQALRIAPQLPSHWPRARAWRRFRGAEFEVEIERVAGRPGTRVAVDGQWLEGDTFSGIEAGRRYRVRVELPGEAGPA
jgi:cellobionic acid phosphorylase